MHAFLVGLEVLLAVIVIASVLLQPSKADGFKGFMTGTVDTFYSRNKSRTKEAFLYKLTVVSASLFAVVTILLNRIAK